MDVTIRPGCRDDDGPLCVLDDETWSWDVSPASPRRESEPFFAEGAQPTDVLVAVVDDQIVGYVKLGAVTPLASNGHVLEIRGLAIDPAHQRHGIGTQLLAAAAREALRRGGRRLRLRVLSSNPVAQRLYEASGYVIEGILREEFLLDGRYVDDVLMVLDLTTATSELSPPGLPAHTPPPRR